MISEDEFDDYNEQLESFDINEVHNLIKIGGVPTFFNYELVVFVTDVLTLFYGYGFCVRTGFDKELKVLAYGIFYDEEVRRYQEEIERVRRPYENTCFDNGSKISFHCITEKDTIRNRDSRWKSLYNYFSKGGFNKSIKLLFLNIMLSISSNLIKAGDAILDWLEKR